MIEEKKLWEIYPHIWKSESAFMSWIRGGIRRSLWNRHPVKLEFIKQNRVKIKNPNPRGKVDEVWGGICALTGEIHVIANLEVDHQKGNNSLQTLKDVEQFISGIVNITLEDLQFVSKEAHKIKSYAEKQGITFDEAKATKQAIEVIKNKADKDYCIKYSLGVPSKQAERRALIIEHLLTTSFNSKEKEDV